MRILTRIAQALVIIAVASSFAHADNFMYFKKKAAAAGGGDGPNAWYDITTSFSAGQDTSSTYAHYGVVTVATGGSATKMRVYIKAVTAANTLKVALYNSAGTSLLASGSGSSGGTEGVYAEITFGIPATITPGTYLLAVQGSDANIQYGAVTSVGDGSEVSIAYASFPPTPIVESWDDDKLLTVGLYVD